MGGTDTVGCNDLPVICWGGSGKSRQWLTTDRMKGAVVCTNPDEVSTATK
jgi:hypothetical protein